MPGDQFWEVGFPKDTSCRIRRVRRSSKSTPSCSRHWPQSIGTILYKHAEGAACCAFLNSFCTTGTLTNPRKYLPFGTVRNTSFCRYLNFVEHFTVPALGRSLDATAHHHSGVAVRRWRRLLRIYPVGRRRRMQRKSALRP